MRLLRKIALLLPSFLLLMFVYEGLAQDQRVVQIKQLVSDLYNRHLFNGAIVIGENGKIILSEGYGFANFKDSVLFTPFTSADGGSNAKTFTAASILWLAEKKELKLDDPIQQYLTDYPYSNTRVWNFITHSLGGLPDYDYYFSRAADTAIVTNELNLKFIATNRPSIPYSPNTNFQYDNVGFDLASLIVEKVSGLRYEQFLREHILGPLKMNSTFIRPSRFEQWQPQRTIGYRYHDDSLQLFDIADREGFYGGSNLWFDASDLYNWGTSFYHQPIFSKQLIKQITSPVSIAGKPSQLTLGAWYHGKSGDAFYYWGNVAGFYSWVYWDKGKKFTIAFMSNTNTPQWTRPLFTSALIDIMMGKNYEPIKEGDYSLILPDHLDQIKGTYQLNDGRKLEIIIDGGEVNARVNNGMKYRMYLVENKTFYAPGLEPWISFSSISANKFQVIHWISTILQTSGKRVAD